MNDQLEERLERMLGRRATSAGEGETLVRTATTRGQRLIRRRRITAGVACAAIAAVAVPVAVNNLGADERTILPTETSTARPELPDEPVEVRIDLAKLSKGEAPEVPYFFDGAIHDGSRSTPLDAERGDEVTFSPVEGGGYAVQVGDVFSEQRNGFLIDADGNKVRDLPVLTDVTSDAYPVVSTDGRRLAWSDWNMESGKSTLVLADAETGEVLRRKPVPDTIWAYPVGFLGDRVAFSNDAIDNGFTRSWDPETGDFTDLLEQPAEGTDGAKRVATESQRQGGRLCHHVVDVGDDDPPWSTCDVDFAASDVLSADGRYAFGRVNQSGREKLAVLDAATGTELLDIGPPAYPQHQLAVEPNGDLLAVWGDGRENALVRCSLEGDCELASDVLPVANSPEAAWALPRD